MNFVTAINTIQNKPWAFLILLTGFGMLICCKKYGIDTTIAGGVIGVASNMMISKPESADVPPNTSLNSTTTFTTAPLESPK